MCIIVAKEIGVEMPSDEILERCFWSNPDGAGFMYADGKRVRIRKGFMEFDDFIDALHKEIDEPLNTAVIMHFRIATHGKVQPATCHPFPITDKREELKKPRCDTRFGVAHNGIISGRTTSDDWSDTMDFVASVMAPLAKMNPGFMFSDDALELLKGACRSKLAIMDNSGEIALVGDFTEDNGVKYSNTSYMKTVSNYTSYKSLWSYDNYSSAYGKYGVYGTFGRYDYDPDWEDLSIERAIGCLPYYEDGFGPCAKCVFKEECATDFPTCESMREAEEAVEYYSSLDPEELGIENTLA